MKQSESHKKSVLKYRKNGAKQLRVQYTIDEYNKIVEYCKHINTPIGSWIHMLTRREIDLNYSFTDIDDDEQ